MKWWTEDGHTLVLHHFTINSIPFAVPWLPSCSMIQKKLKVMHFDLTKFIFYHICVRFFLLLLLYFCSSWKMHMHKWMWNQLLFVTHRLSLEWKQPQYKSSRQHKFYVLCPLVCPIAEVRYAIFIIVQMCSWIISITIFYFLKWIFFSSNKSLAQIAYVILR